MVDELLSSQDQEEFDQDWARYLDYCIQKNIKPSFQQFLRATDFHDECGDR